MPCALLLLLPTAVRAQETRSAPRPVPITYGIGGGGSIPLGGVADSVRTGFNVLGVVQYRPNGSWMAYRLDFLFLRSTLDGVDGTLRAIALGLNARFDLASGRVRPYVIAGTGIYNRWFSFNDESREVLESRQTKGGVSGGAGIEGTLGGTRIFLEARYHLILTSPNSTAIVPVTLGITFR
ncbi:MAG TPA: hypothetical protein VFK13_03430 [Gemmatimonadaceae bacterium]|nr:hypothetical protein [Gemmatimonadaceae bacterium]